LEEAWLSWYQSELVPGLLQTADYAGLRSLAGFAPRAM